MFFIFGSPRSGTTLLAQILSNHPEIIIPDETDFIIPMAFLFDRVQDHRVGREILFKIITGSRKFTKSIGEFLTPDDVFAIVSQCQYTPSALLDDLYAGIAKAAKAKIAGDKSPNDLNYLRILIKVNGISSDTKVIHIIRDVRDIMTSLNRLDWVPGLDSYFPRFWSSSNLYLHSQFNDKRMQYFQIRYEDLARSPHEIVPALCKFLGIPFNEAMLNSSSFHSRYKSMLHHYKLYSPINTERIGIYHKEAKKSAIREWENQAREALETFRYEPSKSNFLQKFLKER